MTLAIFSGSVATPLAKFSLDDMAEVAHLLLQDVTFGLQLQAMLLQPVEHHLQHVKMLLGGLGEDYDIVEVDEDRLHIQVTQTRHHH